MRLMAAIAAIAAACAAAWWLFLKEGPPECPSDSPYCDRTAYVSQAKAGCIAGMSEREAQVIRQTTTTDGYCACMAATMFDSFDAATLWQLDRGESGGAHYQLVANAKAWATACLKP